MLSGMNHPQVFSRVILCDQCNHEFVVDRVDDIGMNSSFSYTPSESATAVIRARVQVEERMLNRCIQEIKRLYQAIEILEKERAELEIRLSRRRSSLSAIRKLPVELWTNIFTEVCQSEENALSVTHRKIIMPPVVLSQVCSRWREIIGNLPQLWTSISVDLFDLRWDVRDLITLFVEKSQMHPLKIQIHYCDPFASHVYPPEVTETGRMALHTLMAHAERCIEFQCELSGEQFSALSSSSLVFSFPQLRTFECHSDMPSSWESDWFFEALSETAPNLEVIKVWTAPDLDVIPYSQLTMLSIDRQPGAERLFELLRSCKSLQSLTIEEFETDSLEEEIMIFAPVVLPILQRLSVGLGPYFPHLTLGPLASTLSLPSLESLEIKSRPHPDDNDEWPPSLLTMLQSASSTLKELSFRNHITLSGDSFPLNGIFESCPNLVRLSFWAVNEDVGSTFIPDLFTILTIPSNAYSPAAIVAPRLTHLEIEFREGRALLEHEAGIILSMAESRTNTHLLSLAVGSESNIAALQNVKIIYDRVYGFGGAQYDRNPFERAHLKGRLDTLKNEGVHLSVLCSLTHPKSPIPSPTGYESPQSPYYSTPTSSDYFD
ncbi:hypothetical protein WG66_007694 [Moniliophthora roreri]|nr:hypothetical protein WG66_007694 [Moniliophthora roreri]